MKSNVTFFLKWIWILIFQDTYNLEFYLAELHLLGQAQLQSFWIENYIFIKPLQIIGKCQKNWLKFHSQFNLAYVCSAAEKVISTLAFMLELRFIWLQSEMIKMV